MTQSTPPSSQFHQVLELTETLSNSEQKLLIEILQNRLNEQHNPYIPKHRIAPDAIAGKGKTLGDLVSPIVDEEDWECLK
ncbi:hypothetical protein PN462_12105 [Spirulina sp. CS-785/01]|uniref:hypothetical protein n=1 Tax=Spirulina sp. CS-785/01 TaxID=3021716 RepID=UPI00232B3375|nr:hypothetical protein [Spirulina sp. CS-785/01]MDB9313846.1 hypothetical protein [Spirulina sp. CS-785/01]